MILDAKVLASYPPVDEMLADKLLKEELQKNQKK